MTAFLWPDHRLVDSSRPSSHQAEPEGDGTGAGVRKAFKRAMKRNRVKTAVRPTGSC